MIFFGSHGCGYFNIIVMEKIMKKQNQILSLAQSLEFYTNGTLPLPHHLDKERTPFFDDEEINAAKAAIRSYVEKGLLKLYGISGQIEINDVPSMDDNFLKVTPQNGKEILYPFNEWIDVETPNSYFSHHYPVSNISHPREILPTDLSAYEIDWQHSLVLKGPLCTNAADGHPSFATEGFAFVVIDFEELELLKMADDMDMTEAEEDLSDKIEEKNGKSDIKKAYRVFAIKLREAGYNLNQATIEIRGVFNAFNSSYPTERTIREHIRDIIPAKD